MTSKAAASFMCAALLLMADDALSACNPGDRRPGLLSQGITPGAIVNIAFDTAVNLSGCAREKLIEGMTNWNGAKGVSFAINNPTADTLVFVKVTDGPGTVGYDPTAWAVTATPVPQGGFQNGYATVATVYLQNKFVTELDVANAHCNGIAVVGSHEFGH